MGATSEWLRIVGFGTLFMLFMLVLNLGTNTKPLASPRGMGKLLSVLNFAACSFAVGMVHVFDWKVLLHGKLGVLFLLVTLASVFTALARARAHRGAAS